MDVNQTPAPALHDNPTGCCPRFDPAAWDGLDLKFEHKLFVRVSTVSVLHVPLGMDAMFRRTGDAIKRAGADSTGALVLSHDDGPWATEHLFAVDRPIPGAEMMELTGDFVTKVFDGPYRNAAAWAAEMEELVRSKGKTFETLYFYYTTCPKCARTYGHNYVVGMVRTGATSH